jgi:hypothetical protein
MRGIIAIIVSGLMLSGCSILEPSVAPISAGDAITLATAQDKSRQECFKAMIKQAENDLYAMSKMSQEQAYNWLVLQQMQKGNDNATVVSLAIIEWASGGKVKRNLGQCNSTNIWDYFASSDVAKYELVGKAINGGLRILNTVVDGVITYYLADGAGAISSEGGISLNESDGNIILVSNDKLSEASQKSVSLSNTPTKEVNTQVGTDDSANSGTYQPTTANGEQSTANPAGGPVTGTDPVIVPPVTGTDPVTVTAD